MTSTARLRSSTTTATWPVSTSKSRKKRAGARTVYEGSGTGLSIVKKLVEAMGGTISWTSAKGQGTTFCVTLSFAIDTACRIDRSDVGNVPDPLRGANVLLVEDNEMNMEIAECLLVDLGARVTRAWDGQEAVDIFAASSTGAFDIVFMDIMMPRKNGLEATRAIRALDRPDAKNGPYLRHVGKRVPRRRAGKP